MLEEWDQLLLNARHDYYILTFIPNQVLFQLLKYFSETNHSHKMKRHLENVFRLIDRRIDMDSDIPVRASPELSSPELTNEKAVHIIGQRLNEIFSPQRNIVLQIHEGNAQVNMYLI
jgi:hypothetical protein